MPATTYSFISTQVNSWFVVLLIKYRNCHQQPHLSTSSLTSNHERQNIPLYPKASKQIIMSSTTIITDPGVEEAAVSDTMIIVLIVVAAVVSCFLFFAFAYCRQQNLKGQVADSAHTHESSPHGMQTESFVATDFFQNDSPHSLVLLSLFPSLAWPRQRRPMN